MSLIKQSETNNLSFSVSKGKRDLSDLELQKLLKKRKFKDLINISSVWFVIIPKELIE